MIIPSPVCPVRAAAVPGPSPPTPAPWFILIQNSTVHLFPRAGPPSAKEGSRASRACPVGVGVFGRGGVLPAAATEFPGERRGAGAAGREKAGMVRKEAEPVRT